MPVARRVGIAIPEFERMLTTSDVAAIIGVDPRTISRKVETGAIPAPDLRSSRTIRWKPETIRLFLGGQTTAIVPPR